MFPTSIKYFLFSCSINYSNIPIFLFAIFKPLFLINLLLFAGISNCFSFFCLADKRNITFYCMLIIIYSVHVTICCHTIPEFLWLPASIWTIFCLIYLWFSFIFFILSSFFTLFLFCLTIYSNSILKKDDLEVNFLNSWMPKNVFFCPHNCLII